MINGHKISGYLLSYNNEETIKKALNSFYGLCDEIIVLHEEGNDRTGEIIKQESLNNPIKIYDFKMNGDWAEARNFALSKCSGDWIITVDADEWFDEKGKGQIKELIKKDCDVWEVIQYSYIDGGDVLLVPTARIFKKGLYYTLPTHETLLDSINEKGYRVGKSNVIMYHTGYKGDVSGKIERNFNILKQDHPLFNYYTGLLQILNEEDGIEYMTKALDEVKNESLLAYIYSVLGEQYFKKGEIYSAITCLNKSLQIEPVQNFANKLLSDIYITIGMLDNAIKHLEEIAQNSKVIRCRAFNDRIFSGIEESLNELKQYKQNIYKELKIN